MQKIQRKTVYTYFKKWKDQNLFEEVNDYLRKSLRILLGRNEEPTAAIIDSQSVKTVEKLRRINNFE